jgi:CO dehydrogenase maturation factor
MLFCFRRGKQTVISVFPFKVFGNASEGIASMQAAKKIAITGKGGVGKSTLTAALALLTARKGYNVLTIDADPDANLASALGIPLRSQQSIVTIARHKQLIEERTGAKINQYGQIFKLNPEVSDITDTYAYHHQGVDLLVLGAIQSGGSGCACPENVLLRALVQDLVVHRNEILFMDMEPGIEHLGRATARGVSSFIIVVEPGVRSIESYKRISLMAGDVGVQNIFVVGNKVKTPEDEKLIRTGVNPEQIMGMIPYSNAILYSDRDGKSVIDNLDENLTGLFDTILQKLI